MVPNSPSDMDHCGSGFLDLGPPIKAYHYEGIEQFWRIWHEQLKQEREGLLGTDLVLFTDVDEETFTREFLNSPDKIIARSWNAYDKHQHLLLTRMPPSTPHEIAVRTFDSIMTATLLPMGLEEKIEFSGSAASESEAGKKRPDCRYRPTRAPRSHPKDCPTMVVEVGYSESPSKLMSDVRYWLGHSDVNVVVTLRINRRTPELTIEKWQRSNSYSNGRPHREQSISIRKRADDRIDIRGGPLVIDFDKLFLRPPAIPREGAIELPDERFRNMAIKIWRMQRFCRDEDEELDAEADQ